VGEKTIWYEMAELIFEKKTDDGLSWGITFYSNAPTLRHQSGWKKGLKKTSHEVFLSENFTRCFQLEIGDVIGKMGSCRWGVLFVIWQVTGESFSATRSHLAADISN
jgi:hypothetical protein